LTSDDKKSAPFEYKYVICSGEAILKMEDGANRRFFEVGHKSDYAFSNFFHYFVLLNKVK